MGPPARNPFVHHFTHLDNFPAVLAENALLADSDVPAGRLATDVGDAGIKGARRRRQVPVKPGGVVADYDLRYLAQADTLENRAGVSELEIQKLADFLQSLGLRQGLRFERGRYGPYAEALHPVLQEMEGHQIVGYGDRSTPVLDLQPILVTPDGLAEATTQLAGDAEATRAVEAVLGLLDGFETPYSVELLATVHFAADRAGGNADDGALSEMVASWSLRKARLFTDEHVRLAAERLRERDLLAG